MTDIFNKQKSQTPQKNTTANSSPAVSFAGGNPFHIFTSFVEKPQGITFNGQQSSEDILVFLRRHFITNVPWIILTFLLLFVPFIVNFILQTINFTFPFLSNSFILLLLIFYYLLVFGYAFANFVSWFYNIGIITQKRIININFAYLSQINVAVSFVSEIEEATFFQPGIFASFFDFGSVHARLLAGKDDFVFTNIPHPVRVSNILSQLLGD
jgi:hypothetical protein